MSSRGQSMVSSLAHEVANLNLETVEKRKYNEEVLEIKRMTSRF